ncbi:2-oxoacid:acceptor oxidoreductase family protein [bacterium]|nr:2-oxoacid:acceptor oxidoreductase family protein [bacterium]
MAKDILRKPKGFNDVYFNKPGADKENTHYCPGCGHGVVHKLIAEALEDFGVADRAIMISPVGCSVFVYYYFATGNVQAAHGRAPAVATGLKRANPDSIVISYQGDGDLGAIGGNNILQAANRGENITVIFVNNAIYGMTGGQMAPTTLVGQRTMTTPYGRSVENEGYPIKICELLASLESPAYLERTAITDVKNIMKTRLAIRKAIKVQIDNKGFSLVEILSACPSGWRMTPRKAKEWITTNMMPYFKPGVYKDVLNERKPYAPAKLNLSLDEIDEKLGLKEEAPSFPGDMSGLKENHRNPRIKVAGFGGQGVLMLGNVLAEAGMLQGYEVSWLPSYGPEMRGGTANCQVHIDEDKIGSPVVSDSTVLIAMNKPSLDKFVPDVVPGGVVLYNTSMIDQAPRRKDLEIIPVPASEIADATGDLKVANMVMIGAYLETTKVVSKEAVFAALDIAIKHKGFIPMNQKAIEQGIEHVRKIKG